MGSLASEKRPGSSLSPSFKWAAIWTLAVSIVVVAPPAGTKRRIHLENGINYPERSFNQGIAWLADAVADQLQKTGVNNIFCRKLPRRPGMLIAYPQHHIT